MADEKPNPNIVQGDDAAIEEHIEAGLKKGHIKDATKEEKSDVGRFTRELSAQVARNAATNAPDANDKIATQDKTPLDIAEEKGHTDIAEVLREAGGKTSAEQRLEQAQWNDYAAHAGVQKAEFGAKQEVDWASRMREQAEKSKSEDRGRG